MSELNFWKPEKTGDKIEGKFAGAYRMGLGHSIKLMVDDGPGVYVNLTFMVASALKSSPPRSGDKIRIEYRGTEKRTKMFDVFVNDKLADPNAPVDLSGALDASIEQGRNPKK